MSDGMFHRCASALLVDRDSGSGPSGVVFAIAHAEQVHVTPAGVEDFDSNVPTSTAHTQDIASVSKVLTTLAVLALVGRDRLTLDTTLSHVLGDRGALHSGVTIEDLLRHRSGLREWWPLYLEPNGPDDPVATALSLPPRAPRDSARHYSDLGMLVLGEVIERVTGISFVAAVQELVLGPVGAETVTPAAPAAHLPALSGPEGDAIEHEMVRSGKPYAVGRSGADFPWRTTRLARETADGNAFHAFGGAAGHAGWFSDIDGLLRIASALSDLGRLGIDPATQRSMSIARDAGQSLGVRRYIVRWRGKDRDVLGHPGFTGAFVGASAAFDEEPELRITLLANRLHGVPAPRRDQLVDVEALWRRAVASADAIFNPNMSGIRP
jgi:CubicO group peptidase (beta-lactamase class C family)